MMNISFLETVYDNVTGRHAAKTQQNHLRTWNTLLQFIKYSIVIKLGYESNSDFVLLDCIDCLLVSRSIPDHINQEVEDWKLAMNKHSKYLAREQRASERSDNQILTNQSITLDGAKKQIDRMSISFSLFGVCI